LRPGTYVVRLEALDGNRLLALSTVSVEAGGRLDLPAGAALFETTSIAASGLAAGLAYEFSFGDGASAVGVADQAGGLVVEHEYDRPYVRFSVALALVEGGQRTPVDTGRIDLVLPGSTETLQVSQAPIPGVAGLRLTVSAGDLLSGVDYLVSGEAFGTVPLTRSSPESGEATFDVYAEGPIAIGLDALLEVP